MFCRSCGLKAEGNDAFCIGCGVPLKKNQNSHDPNRVYGLGGGYDPNRPYGVAGFHDPNRGYNSGGYHEPNRPYNPAGYQEPANPYEPSGYQDPNRSYEPSGSYGHNQPYAPTGSTYSPPPRRPSKTPIIIAVACVVVVLIGFFVMNGGLSRDPLIGTWDYHFSDSNDRFSITFNRDGTVVTEQYDSWDGRIHRDHFTYVVEGNRMRIYQHGHFEDETNFRINGNQLTIYDEWETMIFTRRR